MRNHGLRPFILTRSRALLAALALFAIGAASTAAVYEWKGMTIVSTPLDDGSTRVEVTKDGKKIMDQIVRPDEGAMVTDDGGMIVVEPAGKRSEAPKDPR